MAEGASQPFRTGPGWELDRKNPVVRAFSDADAADFERLGTVGRLTGAGDEYALVWRIVSETGIPLSDIEAEWTFDRMSGFADFLAMKNDYKSAWHEFYTHRDDDGRR